MEKGKSLKRIYSLVVALVLLVGLMTTNLVQVANASGTNLLTNGDAEAGLTGSWGGNGVPEATQELAHGGAYSIKVAYDGLSMAYITYMFDTAVAEDKEYEFSVWVRLADSATESTVQYQSCSMDENWGQLRNPNWQVISCAQSGVWNQFTDTVVVKAGTKIVQMQLYTDRVGTDFYLDDASFSVKEVAPSTTSVKVDFQTVAADGTWQLKPEVMTGFTASYYKVPVVIDGTSYPVAVEKMGELLCIYPSFFGVYQGTVPATSFELSENAIFTPVDPNNGWSEIAGGATVTNTSTLRVTKTGDTWGIPTQGINYLQINSTDLTVYQTADQAVTNYRSVFGIKTTAGQTVVNDANWNNFVLGEGSVKVDGTTAEVIFGMVPAGDGTDWECTSAFLIYVVDENYRDSATTASTLTIANGTKIVSPLDSSCAYEIVGDFTIYNNNGTWSTTRHEHTYNQEVVADEYKVSGATCAKKATYYKSCECGEQGTETFEIGELAVHKYTNYVADNNATCTKNGTKTAVCDYGCGTTDADEIPNTIKAHTDADADNRCDGCKIMMKQEESKEEPKEEPKEEKTQEIVQEKTSVATGDGTNILIYLVAFVMAAGIIVEYFERRQERQL